VAETLPDFFKKLSMKIHFLYKTTNKINGHFYIGIHSTTNVNDYYIGSGKRFLNEVKKYGKSNFSREILQYFDTRDLALDAEYDLVCKNLHDSNCLNLCEGGRAGGLNQEAHIKSKEIRDWLRETDPIWNEKVSIAVSKGLKEFYKNNPGTFTGRTHKPETIEKMKLTAAGRGKGDKNSQFGSFWITNGLENKKTRSEDIPNGWRKGRVLKS